MEAWLEWARGPAFVFSFSFMVLGLVRHLALTVAEIRRTMRRAGDKSLPSAKLARATFEWLVPIRKIRNEFLYSATSVSFHICILIVPVFLGGHIALWARGIGVSWPAIPNDVADVLAIVAIVAAVALIVQRLSARATRALSGFQDYALPLLIAVPFVTGFLAMHPASNPFSYDSVLFVHVMSANFIFVLVPITKLSHVALMPSAQFVSEIGWKWPSDSGIRVAVALRKEEEPV